MQLYQMQLVSQRKTGEIKMNKAVMMTFLLTGICALMLFAVKSESQTQQITQLEIVDFHSQSMKNNCASCHR